MTETENFDPEHDEFPVEDAGSEKFRIRLENERTQTSGGKAAYCLCFGRRVWAASSSVLRDDVCDYVSLSDQAVYLDIGRSRGM